MRGATLKPIIDTADCMTPYINVLRERGVRTVIRYFNHRNGDLPNKCLKLAEAQSLTDAGFTLAVVFEQRGGARGNIGDLDQAHGVQDAARALDLAASLNQPEGSAIYFAVDDDYYTASQLALIEPYFAEVRKALANKYRVGIYASGTVASWMLTRGYVDLVWLCGSTGWSGTREFLRSGHWALFQGEMEKTERTLLGMFGYDGSDVHPEQPDFGQFTLGSVSVSTPTPAAPAIMQVNARSGLKLRPTASLELTELTTVPNNTVVHGLRRVGDFIQVDLNGDGVADGFMYAAYLQTLAGSI